MSAEDDLLDRWWQEKREKRTWRRMVRVMFVLYCAALFWGEWLPIALFLGGAVVSSFLTVMVQVHERAALRARKGRKP